MAAGAAGPRWRRSALPLLVLGALACSSTAAAAAAAASDPLQQVGGAEVHWHPTLEPVELGKGGGLGRLSHTRTPASGLLPLLLLQEAQEFTCDALDKVPAEQRCSFLRDKCPAGACGTAPHRELLVTIRGRCRATLAQLDAHTSCCCWYRREPRAVCTAVLLPHRPPQRRAADGVPGECCAVP